MTGKKRSDLVDQALAVWPKAYAPYSNFHVGAALQTKEGHVFTGVNVENAAYPEGVCAEASAISAMVTSGADREITDVVVVGAGDAAVTPCGGCRQKIREFGGPNTRITMVNEKGDVMMERTLSDLLPDSFGPDHLE